MTKKRNETDSVFAATMIPKRILRQARNTQRAAAENVRTGDARSGLLTGFRIALWLGSMPDGASVTEMADALLIDRAHIRRSLKMLAKHKLVCEYTRLSHGTSPMNYYHLPGDANVCL